MNPISNNASNQWLNNWQDVYQKAGIQPIDPSQSINVTTTNSNGIFGGVLNDGSIHNSVPWEDPIISITERIAKLETQNKFLKLKILGMEGKFTQEEIANIRKMLMSNDEASITLADSIIENA